MSDKISQELLQLRMTVEGLVHAFGRVESKVNEIAESVAKSEIASSGVPESKLPLITQLTPRQHLILQGVVYGLENEIVGQIMGGISVETVKTHQRMVGKKLGVTKKTELRVMGQKFLEQGTDTEYIAATGGFGKNYALETNPAVQDEHRHLFRPKLPSGPSFF